MAQPGSKHAELKATLISKLCEQHGATSRVERALVEREVEKSSALQSTKLTPAALKELESAVARAVQNQDNVGRAIIEQKSFNCQPDIGARLLNLNISGGGFSSSHPKPRRSETWDRFRDQSANEDMIANFVVSHHLQRDAVGEYVLTHLLLLTCARSQGQCPQAQPSSLFLESSNSVCMITLRI